MSIIDNGCVTLADLASRLKGDGMTVDQQIVEALYKKNDILDDAMFKEGNLLTGNKTTVRTGLPALTWRKLYQGVQDTKSTTEQIVDTCGMLEGYSEVDKALADLGGNAKAVRATEDIAFVESFNQEIAKALFYGDQTVDKEKITGLTPRFNSLSTSVKNSVNIIDAGGTGSDNQSIWLVGWGEDGAFCFFPKGSKSGFTMEDKGQVTCFDGSGRKFEGYRTHFKWDIGFTVRDWRQVVRIANIDTSNLKTAGDASDTSANIIKYMSWALNKIIKPNSVKLAFYMTRTCKAMLLTKIMSKSNTFLTIGDYEGRQNILQFMGIPVRICDSLLETESQVTA
jgi:hypothetical protein